MTYTQLVRAAAATRNQIDKLEKKLATPLLYDEQARSRQLVEYNQLLCSLTAIEQTMGQHIKNTELRAQNEATRLEQDQLALALRNKELAGRSEKQAVASRKLELAEKLTARRADKLARIEQNEQLATRSIVGTSQIEQELLEARSAQDKINNLAQLEQRQLTGNDLAQLQALTNQINELTDTIEMYQSNFGPDWRQLVGMQDTLDAGDLGNAPPIVPLDIASML